MCLRCAVDEGTEQGYCRECGCLIGLFEGEPLCTPDECWCAKQADVGDWHALREDVSASTGPLPTWAALLDCFEDGPERPSADLPQPQGGAGAEEATHGQAESAHELEGVRDVLPRQAQGR
jgi:hypothetical protein